MIYASYTFPYYLHHRDMMMLELPTSVNESKIDILNDISKHTVDLIDNVNDIEQKYQDYQTTRSIERREQDMVAIEKDVEKSIQDVEIIYTDIQKIRKPSTQSSWWF
jgi:hypothetical protein